MKFIAINSTFSLFFFQAEDGIRDYKVTGVQTCALPISRDICNQALSSAASRWQGPYLSREIPAGGLPSGSATIRSEERRVGKEWRYGGQHNLYKQRIE